MAREEYTRRDAPSTPWRENANQRKLAEVKRRTFLISQVSPTLTDSVFGFLGVMGHKKPRPLLKNR